MNRLSLSIFFMIFVVVTGSSLTAFDNFHFYRASYFVGEPRLAKNGLGSLDVYFGGGATNIARNGQGQKTCLLNIYGLENMHDLGVNVPNKDNSNPIDITLTNLALVPSRGCFGELLFKGRFSIQEAYLQFTQNAHCGFFFQMAVPFRHIQIKDVGFSDASPTNDVYPNINTPVWQTFLNLFEPTMNRYGLDVGPVSKSGIGDISAYVGWAYNFQETEVLDFIDTTFKAGLYIPTGHVKNPNIVFDLPLGYDGHIGVPFELNGSVGSYDWFTFGGHVGGIVFVPKTKCLRMKTDLSQNGFIKLAQGKARVTLGSIWHTGLFVKADHFCRGLSLLAGYTFAQERQSQIAPCDLCTFNESVVNSDAMFKGWTLHTVHFLADYDFAQEPVPCLPHVSIFYNREVAGRRTFNTSIGGGIVGFDLVWTF